MHDPYSLVSRPFLTSEECDEIIKTHDIGLELKEQSVYRKVRIKEIDLYNKYSDIKKYNL